MIERTDGTRVKVCLIAAMARNRVIGNQGDLPWHLPNDLKRFKKLTLGHAVVMGRATYETLPGPLPRRVNVVVTRQTNYERSGIHVTRDVESGLRLAADLGDPSLERLYVVGGGQIYEAAMPWADEIDRTLIDTEVVGDAWFPAIDESKWQIIESTSHAPDDEHAAGYTFQKLIRASTPRPKPNNLKTLGSFKRKVKPGKPTPLLRLSRTRHFDQKLGTLGLVCAKKVATSQKPSGVHLQGRLYFLWVALYSFRPCGHAQFQTCEEICCEERCSHCRCRSRCRCHRPDINITATKTEVGFGETVGFLVSWTGAPLAQYDILVSAAAGLVGNIKSLVVLGGDDDDFYAGTVIANLGPNTVNDAIPGAGVTNTGTTLNVGQSVLALNAPAAEDLTNSTGNALADLGPFASFNDAGLGNVDANPNALFSFVVTAGDVEGDLQFAVSEGERAADGIGTFPQRLRRPHRVSSFAAYTDIAVNSAVVRVVPAPASVALLGLGGLVATRRRR